jgi:hypothetical protein
VNVYHEGLVIAGADVYGRCAHAVESADAKNVNQISGTCIANPSYFGNFEEGNVLIYLQR